jgi:hypothetical protein
MLGPDLLVALDLGPRLVRNQFRDDVEEQLARTDGRASKNLIRRLLRSTPRRTRAAALDT